MKRGYKFLPSKKQTGRVFLLQRTAVKARSMAWPCVCKFQIIWDKSDLLAMCKSNSCDMAPTIGCVIM